MLNMLSTPMHPKALILWHVVGRMLMESCLGEQFHQFSSALGELARMAGC